MPDVCGRGAALKLTCLEHLFELLLTICAHSPALQLRGGVAMATTCVSTRRHDSAVARCQPWCALRQHCSFCKCRACALCQKDRDHHAVPPPPPPSHTASAAADNVSRWANAAAGYRWPSATAGYRWPCRHCAERRVWAVRLPCSSGALPSLPREAGCWMRSVRGCPKEPSERSAMHNWSRLVATAAERSRELDWCLVAQQNAADQRCFSPRQLKAWHSVQAVFVASSLPRRCTMVQQALAWQVPRRGFCFSVGAHEPAPRYVTNHGHQAELLMPMLEHALAAESAPEFIRWHWPLTHWVAELLPAALPFTELLTSAAQPLPAAYRERGRTCRTFSPIGTDRHSRWLRDKHAPVLLRRAVLRHCGLHEARITRAARAAAATRVVLLLRGDTQQNATLNQTVGDEKRAFANLSQIVLELRRALPGAQLAIVVTRGRAPLCEQVGWFHGASLVVSPHGAHLTNALWLAEGAMLLEVMPWGMWEYPRTYTGLLKGSGVQHDRLRSMRPPPDAPHYNATAAGGPELDQRRCGRDEACRRFYRGHSSLYLAPGSMCAVVRRRFRAQATANNLTEGPNCSGDAN